MPGIGRPQRKLTADDVRVIVELYENDRYSTGQLSVRFGVSRPQIQAIITGRSWVSITGGTNRSRHRRETFVPDWRYRDRLSAEVDVMVTRMASELEVSESEVRRHLRRIFHPKPEDRKEQ